MKSSDIKVGFMFSHKRHITTDGRPETYRVTHRIGGNVYYRSINQAGEYIGTPFKTNIKYFLSNVFGGL